MLEFTNRKEKDSWSSEVEQMEQQTEGKVNYLMLSFDSWYLGIPYIHSENNYLEA